MSSSTESTVLYLNVSIPSEFNSGESSASEEVLAYFRNSLERYLGESQGNVYPLPSKSGILVVFDSPSRGAVCIVQLWNDLLLSSEQARIIPAAAVHAGNACNPEDVCYEADISRVGWICEAANPGQILVSSKAFELLKNSMPREITFIDLGVHRFKDLLGPENLYQIWSAGEKPPYQRICSLDSYPHNLPIQQNQFFDRRNEIMTIHSMFRQYSSISLVGPGGVGKTRLALHAAAEIITDFPQGVYFISCADLHQASDIFPRIAVLIGMSQLSGTLKDNAVLEQLKSRKMLLILDNLEHIPAVEGELSGLLSGGSDIRLIFTSRHTLELENNYNIEIQSLECPNLNLTVFRLPLEKTPVCRDEREWEQLSQYDAFRLFVSRIRTEGRELVVDDDTTPIIAEICYRLNGLPLAIELTAVHYGDLTLNQLLDEMDRKLPFLKNETSAGPVRHHSLRDTIRWSYDLLSREEQQVLKGISVFSGKFFLDSALELLALEYDFGYPFADIIPRLLEKSFLRVTESDSGEEFFFMMFTIREFGLELLESEGNLLSFQQKHAVYYYSKIRVPSTGPIYDSDTGWQKGMDIEVDNYYGALRWYINQDKELDAIRLVIALYPFWGRTLNVSEALYCVERVFPKSSQSLSRRYPEDIISLYIVRGSLYRQQGLLGDAEKWARKALRLIKKYNHRIPILLQLESRYLMLASGFSSMEPHVLKTEYLEIANAWKKQGDMVNTGRALGMLAANLLDLGMNDEALPFLEECELLVEDNNDPIYLRNRLNYALASGEFQDPERADETYRKFEEILEQNDHPSYAALLNNHAYYLYSLKQYEEALEYYQKQHDLSKKKGILNMLILGKCGIVECGFHLDRDKGYIDYDQISRDALELTNKMMMPEIYATAQMIRGKWLLYEGRKEEGTILLEESLDSFDKSSFDEYTAEIRQLLEKNK